MPRFQVIKKSFIDGIYHNPDEAKEPIFIEFDGIPGSNLKPADDRAKKFAEAAPRLSHETVRKRLKAAAEAENPDLAEAA